MSTALATGVSDGNSNSGDGGSSGGAPSTTGTSSTTTTGGSGQTSSGSAITGDTGTKSWRDSLPEDLKNDPTLAKYSDVPNLAKAYLHAQQAIGKKGVIKPAANAAPEEWKAFREALGVPGADKYEIPPVKGVEFPKETMEWAKKTFAEIGVLPEDASALMLKYAEFEMNRDKKSASTKAETEKSQLQALQKEWGDNYAPELKRGLFAVQQLGEMAGIGKDEAVKWIDKGVGNDPNFIKLMSAAAKLFKEDTLRENGVGGSGHVSASELDGHIKEAQGFLISMDKNDPRRPGALAKFESLSRQRTGGK